MNMRRPNFLLIISLVGIICGMAFLLLSAYRAFYNNNVLYGNAIHIVNARTHLTLNLSQFRGGQTPQELKKQFPALDLDCVAAKDGLGDYACFDEHLSSWNGNHAMRVVFWFAQGKLTHVSINIPQAHHEQAKRYLLTSFGKPHGRDRRAEGQSDIVVWEIESGGGLVFNIDPEPTPLMWSMVLWYSPDEVKRMGGLIKRPS